MSSSGTNAYSELLRLKESRKFSLFIFKEETVWAFLSSMLIHPPYERRRHFMYIGSEPTFHEITRGFVYIHQMEAM